MNGRYWVTGCIPIAVLTPIVDDITTISDRHAGVQNYRLNEPTLLSAALDIHVGVFAQTREIVHGHSMDKNSARTKNIYISLRTQMKNTGRTFFPSERSSTRSSSGIPILKMNDMIR
jgi:hypothetical protein